jgi:hypothetical protein
MCREAGQVLFAGLKMKNKLARACEVMVFRGIS